MSAGDAAHGEYGNNHRGPTFTGQGTWSVVNGAVQIRLPFTHDGGTTLLAYAWTEATNSNAELNATITEATATPGQLRALFGVRLAGNRFQRGRLDTRNTTVPPSSGSYSEQPGVAITLDASIGVTIDNTNNAIVLTCANTTGTGTISFMDGTSMTPAQTQGFTIQFGSDFNLDGQSLGGTCVSLVDDRTDLPGVNYGWPMRAHLDIYAPPPSPAAQTLGFNAPATAVVTGGFLALSGPAGTGTAASGVQVAINGGAKVTPFGLNLYQDNSWDGLIVAPATVAASNTIAVYPAGLTTPSATGTFRTASRAALLGASPAGTDLAYAGLNATEVASCIFSFNAMNAGTMWQDSGRAQPITGNLQGVRAWDDEMGNAGNRLTPTNASAVPPSLDFGAQGSNGYGTGYNLIGCGPAIVFEPVAAFSYNGMAASGPAPMLAQLNGDFTILTVFRVHVDQPWIFNGPHGGIAIGIGNGVANVYRGSNTLPIPAASWGISDNYGCMIIRYQASTDTLKADIRGTTGTPFSHVGTAPNTTLGLNSFLMEPSYGWGSNMLLQGFNSYISDASTASLLATVAPIWG